MFKDLKAKLINSWKSFTNWFNVIGAAVLQTIILDPSLQELLAINDLMWVILVGNIILRFKTTQSLADK